MAPPWLTGRHLMPEDLRHDGNSFTALRWLLASLVMVSHGWDLTQPMRGLDPTVAVLSFPISRLAVFLFFSLSGFLVTGSLFKRGVQSFIMARALRLLPGLWMMLLVVPLLLWLGFATIPAGEFFTDARTWRFIGRNALLLGGEYGLPGVFAGHPLPGAVNGSLWTIPQEVRCYVILALLAACGLTLPRWRLTMLILAGFVLHLALPDSREFYDRLRDLAFSFFLGVFAWLWRDRLRLSWPLALALAALALAIPAEMAGKLAVTQVGFFYLVLLVAFAVPPAWKAASARLPDYSYGIYIYGFPAQQVALALGATDPLLNIALAFAITVPLAALSWHFVEGPALTLKTGKNLPERSKTAG